MDADKPYSCDVCAKSYKRKCNMVNHKRFYHISLYTCNICQKSFSQRSFLSQHNYSAAHVKRKISIHKDTSSNQNTFVDCNEAIKDEDIKEEMNEEESVEDPLYNNKETNKTLCVSHDILEEDIKEEGDKDSLNVQQETGNDNLEEKPPKTIII